MQICNEEQDADSFKICGLHHPSLEEQFTAE